MRLLGSLKLVAPQIQPGRISLLLSIQALYAEAPHMQAAEDRDVLAGPIMVKLQQHPQASNCGSTTPATSSKNSANKTLSPPSNGPTPPSPDISALIRSNLLNHTLSPLSPSSTLTTFDIFVLRLYAQLPMVLSVLSHSRRGYVSTGTIN
jgi:hypothetical protein